MLPAQGSCPCAWAEPGARGRGVHLEVAWLQPDSQAELGSPTDRCLLVLTDPASESIPSLFVDENADQVKSNTVS